MDSSIKIVDKDNPNIWIEQECIDGNLKVSRVVRATDGGISDGPNVTVETITLTKTHLTTLTD